MLDSFLGSLSNADLPFIFHKSRWFTHFDFLLLFPSPCWQAPGIRCSLPRHSPYAFLLSTCAMPACSQHSLLAAAAFAVCVFA